MDFRSKNSQDMQGFGRYDYFVKLTCIIKISRLIWADLFYAFSLRTRAILFLIDGKSRGCDRLSRILAPGNHFNRYRNAQNSSVQENRGTLRHGSSPHLQCEKSKQNWNFFLKILFRISLQFFWLSPFRCKSRIRYFLSLNLKHTIEQKNQSRASWRKVPRFSCIG